MLNVNIIYKPPSSWREILWSRLCPRQFSHLKKFRTLVVLIGVCRKGVILQGIMAPTRVIQNGQSCSIIKGYVVVESFYTPIHRNSLYGNPVRRSIYEIISPKHPHLPILRSTTTPRCPRFTVPLHLAEGKHIPPFYETVDTEPNVMLMPTNTVGL